MELPCRPSPLWLHNWKVNDISSDLNVSPTKRTTNLYLLFPKTKTKGYQSTTAFLNQSRLSAKPRRDEFFPVADCFFVLDSVVAVSVFRRTQQRPRPRAVQTVQVQQKRPGGSIPVQTPRSPTHSLRLSRVRAVLQRQTHGSGASDTGDILRQKHRLQVPADQTIRPGWLSHGTTSKNPRIFGRSVRFLRWSSRLYNFQLLCNWKRPQHGLSLPQRIRIPSFRGSLLLRDRRIAIGVLYEDVQHFLCSTWNFSYW